MTDENELDLNIDAPVTRNPFIVDLSVFDGPIDLLLDLARRQKVDLAQISIVKLADQYLEYIEHAKDLRLEIAADYLVMASWLAYLKSRLLLPVEEQPVEQVTPQAMADLLTFQLKRLEALRQSGEALLARPQLGQQVFKPAKQPHRFVVKQLTFDLQFHDLINSYGRVFTEKQVASYRPPPRRLFKLEDAMERLATMIGLAKDWAPLEIFLPPQIFEDPLMQKSAMASTFGAMLELVKQGQVDVKQDTAFGPIYTKAADGVIMPTATTE
ncbi:MAG TPA: ScpA family protein [Alphaproteobacteria bacterium]